MPFLGLQTSFTAGELSPSLSVRVDLSRYQTGCKKLENMLVHPHGGASKRNGFRYLSSLPGETRLMSFVFSVTETYVLAWSEKRLQFFNKNGAILNEDGSVYSIPSPYSTEEVKELSFVQSADIIYLASTKHSPYKLARYDHTDWRLEKISFAPKAIPPTGTYGYLHDVRTQGEINGDGTGRRNWLYVVTRIDDSGEESLPSAPFAVNAPENLRATCYPKLSWAAYVPPVEEVPSKDPEDSNGTDGTDDETVIIKPEYRIYQEKNGKYGYIGSSLSTSFDAKNIAPDMTDCPPEDANPFKKDNFPGAVCFFQQRLVFAGSEKNPQTIWFSRTGNYESFSKSSPAKADDAMEISIAGNEVSRIEWLVALRTLLVGTSGTEWEVKSSSGALSAGDVSIVPQSYRGSAKLPALVVGNSILHVSRTNREMRDLLYDFGTDSYAGSDHAVLASHLFENKSIEDWAYQQSPNSIIWCVRSDGVLLGHTYLREHQVFAWHRHMTKGKFKSICTIPGKYEDELFAVVQRKINGKECYFLESMENNTGNIEHEEIPEELPETLPEVLPEDYSAQNDGRSETSTEARAPLFFADAALSYQGEAISRVVGLDHLLGEEVCIVADGSVCSNQIVRDFSVKIEETEQAKGRETIQTFNPKTANMLASRNAGNSKDTTSSKKNLGKMTAKTTTEKVEKEITQVGAEELESSQIGLEIPFSAKSIVIGLPYRARLQSMALEPDFGGGTSVGRKKVINRIGVYFKDTNSARIGTDFDAPQCMDEVKWRLSEKPGEAIAMHTEDAWIYTNSAYLNQTHACVESIVPLPCTVLAIIPELSVSSV